MWMQDTICHYLAQEFSDKEVLALISMDLGHGNCDAGLRAAGNGIISRSGAILKMPKEQRCAKCNSAIPDKTHGLKRPEMAHCGMVGAPEFIEPTIPQLSSKDFGYQSLTGLFSAIIFL